MNEVIPFQVNVLDDSLVAEHDLETGDGPLFVDSDGSLPMGLSTGIRYFAIYERSHPDMPPKLRLASSLRHARAHLSITLTTPGTGRHVLRWTP